ncbi:ABC transporter permease [Streptomyces sp. NPDC056231]|uniref:ABC transporter permease n=1 Tax=Streptomyces sp. NPDC056231 TaxID=3345755 RepID=UPI003AAA4706
MNRNFGRLLAVETMKARRAPVFAICTAIIVLAPALLAAAAILALRANSSSSFAAKARLLVHGTEWAGYVGTGAEVMAVAVLLCLGFGFAWCFGREFTEDTVVGLFCLPMGRGAIALAKCTVLLVWSVLVSIASTLVLLGVGLALGDLGSQPPRWWLPLGVCLLTACNTVPLAWLATVTRGYLGAVGGLIGLVVATQLVTAFGGGGWFPWAVPGLWAGFGGAGIQVGGIQFVLPVVVALISVGATTKRWRGRELGNA